MGFKDIEIKQFLLYSTDWQHFLTLNTSVSRYINYEFCHIEYLKFYILKGKFEFMAKTILIKSERSDYSPHTLIF